MKQFFFEGKYQLMRVELKEILCTSFADEVELAHWAASNLSLKQMRALRENLDRQIEELTRQGIALKNFRIMDK